MDLSRKDLDEARPNSNGLIKIAGLMGYDTYPQQLITENGYAVSGLLNFLDDNPGAVEAVLEWIEEFYGNELDDSEDDEEE